MNTHEEMNIADAFDHDVYEKGTHLMVPHFPVDKSIPLADALNCIRPDYQRLVNEGIVRLLAIAHGEEADLEEMISVKLVLLCFGKRQDNPALYFLYDCDDDRIHPAVLMNGDGTKYSEDRPLTQKEAVGLWIGGFLDLNEKLPGLYRLRYALIES